MTRLLPNVIAEWANILAGGRADRAHDSPPAGPKVLVDAELAELYVFDGPLHAP